MSKTVVPISDQIHEALIEHAVDVNRFSESVREQVIGLLEDLGADLDNQISIKGPLTDFQQAKTDQLIKNAQDTIGTQYKKANQVVNDELIDFADLEANYTPRMMNDVFGAELMRNGLTKGDLQELVTDSMIQGAPQKAWWNKQSSDLQGRFAQQIRMGIAAGETNDQIVKRIRGSYTGQKKVITDHEGQKKIIPQYAGGVMDVSKREATALVRTSVQTVSNNVLAKQYEENQDVVKGVQALATLDARTTPLCRARDKKAWYLPGSDPNPQPKKKDKPQPPPPTTEAEAQDDTPPAPPTTFVPPFTKSTPTTDMVSTLKDLPGWENAISDSVFHAMGPATKAKVGNAISLMSYYFDDAAAPDSLSMEKLGNPLYYAQTNIAKGKTDVVLSESMFTDGVKLMHATKKDFKKGQLAGEGPEHVVLHELAHNVKAKNSKLVAKAWGYVKKNMPDAEELSKHGASSPEEAFAEALAKVLKTNGEGLNDWEDGFLDMLNEDLAKSGKPTIG